MPSLSSVVGHEVRERIERRLRVISLYLFHHFNCEVPVSPVSGHVSQRCMYRILADFARVNIPSGLQDRSRIRVVSVAEKPGDIELVTHFILSPVSVSEHHGSFSIPYDDLIPGIAPVPGWVSRSYGHGIAARERRIVVRLKCEVTFVYSDVHKHFRFGIGRAYFKRYSV